MITQKHFTDDVEEKEEKVRDVDNVPLAREEAEGATLTERTVRQCVAS